MQVLAEPALVLPHTGVVDQDGVTDPQRAVVDRTGIGRVDERNAVAICNQCQAIFIDLDGCVESAVNTVGAEQ